MSRRLLVISTVVLLVGVAILIYADPLARLSFGGTPGRFTGAFTSTFTGTFTRTLGNSTFTVSPGSGGFPGVGAAVRTGDTNGQVETLIAIALLAVGLVLEVMTIFLWQSKPKEAAPPTA